MNKAALFVFLLLTAFHVLFASDNKVLSVEGQQEALNQNIQDFWINSPLIMEDAIIFFSRDKAKKILVAGDFNNWKPELLMTNMNTNYFWQYIWDTRLTKGIYKYKYIIDNIWINDPMNTNIIIDESGQMVSYFELKEDFIPHAKYPLWIERDLYEFKFESTKAKSVYLVGDFNNWNPFNIPLKPEGPNEFKTRVRLKPGMHTYCFIVDGDWKADPENLRQYKDEVGNIVSIIFVKDKKTAGKKSSGH